MNEDARTKSAFSTVEFNFEACRSVFKLDYPQLTKIAQNVEAFDACGKTTHHGTFIGARAHMKKHLVFGILLLYSHDGNNLPIRFST